MELEPKSTFLDHALTHLSLIDGADLSERLRLHLHFARIFLELELDGRPAGEGQACIPGGLIPRPEATVAPLSRSGDARPGAAG